jgi:hypothetical protein
LLDEGEEGPVAQFEPCKWWNNPQLM